MGEFNIPQVSKHAASDLLASLSYIRDNHSKHRHDCEYETTNIVEPSVTDHADITYLEQYFQVDNTTHGPTELITAIDIKPDSD